MRRSRQQYRHEIISVQLAVGQQVALKGLIKRRQQLAARVYPARQQRTAEGHAPDVRICLTAGSVACAPRILMSARGPAGLSRLQAVFIVREGLGERLTRAGLAQRAWHWRVNSKGFSGVVAH